MDNSPFLVDLFPIKTLFTGDFPASHVFVYQLHDPRTSAPHTRGPGRALVITAQCQGTLEFPPGATERFIEIEPLGEGIDGFVWRDFDKEVEPDSDAF